MSTNSSPTTSRVHSFYLLNYLLRIVFYIKITVDVECFCLETIELASRVALPKYTKEKEWRTEEGNSDFQGVCTVIIIIFLIIIIIIVNTFSINFVHRILIVN